MTHTLRNIDGKLHWLGGGNCFWPRDEALSKSCVRGGASDIYLLKYFCDGTGDAGVLVEQEEGFNGCSSLLVEVGWVAFCGHQMWIVGTVRIRGRRD